MKIEFGEVREIMGRRNCSLYIDGFYQGLCYEDPANGQLQEHWTRPEDVDYLIVGGDMSSLGDNLADCVFHRRDWDRDDVGPETMRIETDDLPSVLDEFAETLDQEDYWDREFIYLYDRAEAKWWVMGFTYSGRSDPQCGRKWIPLCLHRDVQAEPAA